MTLEEAQINVPVTVAEVGGERGFRRRLMELGLLPGTTVELLRTAPLGDPIEIRVRGSNLSIRKREAQHVLVRPAQAGHAVVTEEHRQVQAGHAMAAEEHRQAPVDVAAVRGASS